MKYMLLYKYGGLVVVKENERYILFNKQLQRWVDQTQIIMDLIMGYDPSEPEDSPYRFGNDPVDYDEITKEEAEAKIGKKIDEEEILKLVK